MSLPKLLSSHIEALEFWKASLADNNSHVSQIKAAAVADPLDELVKLAKLIRAHTTKVGIVFKPETLKKQTDAAYLTLSKLSESIVLTMLLLPQLDGAQLSQVFLEEILAMVELVIQLNISLARELQVLVESENLEEGGDRLVSVGQIWANCDDLTKLIEGGKVGLLARKIKQSIGLIDDGLDEFAEWTENPEDAGDDPFGFSDSESEVSDAEPPAAEDKTELIEYAKRWLDKIRLTKLLLTSVTKLVPSSTSGDKIDVIFALQKEVVRGIDALIVDLMLDQHIDDELKDIASSIDKSCGKLLRLLKDANRGSDSRIKWIDAWHSKYTGI